MGEQVPGDKAGAAETPARGGVYPWYALTLLTLIYIFGSADRAAVAVVTEPLKAEFGLSDSAIGLLTGPAYSVTFAIAVLPLGWLIDRTNRRNLLTATVTIWSALTAICAGAPNFATLVAARMGVGAAEAAASPGSLSLIADTFPPKRRSTAVSIYYAGVALGNVVIFIAGGWLLMHFGWRTVFLVAGVPGLLLAALLYFTTVEPKRGAFDEAPTPAEGKIGYMDTLRDIFGNKALLAAVFAITLSSGVMQSFWYWTASFLVRVHGVAVSQAAIWTGLTIGILMTLGSFMIGPIVDKVTAGRPSRIAWFPVVTLLVGTGAGACMALAPTLNISLIFLCLFGFCGGIVTPMGYNLVLTLAGANVRGATMAVTKLIAIVFGSGLLPLITGMISDAVKGADSIRYALLVTLVFFVFASACSALAGRWAKQKGM